MIVVTCTLNGHLLVIGVYDCFEAATKGADNFASDLPRAQNFQYHTGYELNKTAGLRNDLND